MLRPLGAHGLVCLLAAACGSGGVTDAGLSMPDAGVGADATSAPDAGERTPDATAADAAPLDLRPADAGSAPFDRTSVVTCDTATVARVLRSSCADEALLVAVPERVATVLDLRASGPGAEGTCEPYFGAAGFAEHAILLPRDATAYPMQIILPSVSGADPACEDCGLFVDARAQPLFGEQRVTAFGVAFETYHQDVGSTVFGPNQRTMLAISVPPPWYVVSGGGGEAYPWPCIAGYQEFGIRSCIGLPYGGFGFATVEPDAPSVSAILTLVETAPGLNYWDAEYGDAGCLYRDGD